MSSTAGANILTWRTGLHPLDAEAPDCQTKNDQEAEIT